MKPLAITLLFWLTLSAMAEDLTAANKRAFIQSGVPGCKAKQNEGQLSKIMTEQQVDEYCYCTVAMAADLISVEDLQTLMATKDDKHLTIIMETSANSCINRLMKKWGYTK